MAEIITTASIIAGLSLLVKIIDAFGRNILRIVKDKNNLKRLEQIYFRRIPQKGIILIKVLFILSYFRHLHESICVEERAPDVLIDIDYKFLSKYSFEMFKEILDGNNQPYKEKEIKELFSSITSKIQKVLSKTNIYKSNLKDGQEILNKLFEELESKNSKVYEIKNFLTYNEFNIVKQHFFAKVGLEFIEPISTWKFANFKGKNKGITKLLIEKNSLKFLVTLGGAWLLHDFELKEEWKNEFKRNNEFEIFIQHPFQPKVVLEVLNKTNIKYPAEMIMNWNALESLGFTGKKAFWCREYFIPVSNATKRTDQDIREFWLERYDQAVRTNITGGWINVKATQSWKFDLIDKDEQDLLKEQKYRYFLHHFPTFQEIKVKDKSNIEGLVDIFLEKQKNISEILYRTDEDNFYINIYKVNLLDNKNIDVLDLKKIDTKYFDQNNQGLLWDTDRWHGIGLINLIRFETYWANILVNLLILYRDSESIKLIDEQRNILIGTLEIIKEYIFNHYYEEIFQFIENINKTNLKIDEKVKNAVEEIGVNIDELKGSNF